MVPEGHFGTRKLWKSGWTDLVLGICEGAIPKLLNMCVTLCLFVDFGVFEGFLSAFEVFLRCF
jgi:hypothetical protein